MNPEILAKRVGPPIRKTVSVPVTLFVHYETLARRRGYSSLTDYVCDKLRRDSEDFELTGAPLPNAIR